MNRFRVFLLVVVTLFLILSPLLVLCLLKLYAEWSTYSFDSFIR